MSLTGLKFVLQEVLELTSRPSLRFHCAASFSGHSPCWKFEAQAAPRATLGRWSPQSNSTLLATLRVSVLCTALKGLCEQRAWHVIAWLHASLALDYVKITASQGPPSSTALGDPAELLTGWHPKHHLHPRPDMKEALIRLLKIPMPQSVAAHTVEGLKSSSDVLPSLFEGRS